MTHPTLQDPSKTSDLTMFEILKSASTDGGAARLGRLILANHRVMETPNYLAVASRGVIPHLTPENTERHTTFDAAYMAIEDFLDKKEPPLLQMSKEKPRNLHGFTSFPSERAIVLGPRRFPPVLTPVGNGAQHLSIFTSTGFRNLTVPEFANVVEIAQPEIAIPPADLFHTSSTPPSKRQARMVERTEEWVDEFFRISDPQGRLKELGVAVFAPVLPVEYPLQWDYLRHLSEDVRESLSGLAIYDVNLLPELTNYPPLLALPRLAFGPSKSPQDLLRQLSLGVDICTVPFVNVMSDAGVGLTFTFPPPKTQGIQPLGIDMWSADHATSLLPVAEGCKCYTCTNHHSAFIHHLLNAKEMLGWNLLQIHNHWVLGEFFAGVRKVLAEGTARFEECSRDFSATYEPELPFGTGERPRARGYHFKSIAGQTKINEPSWQAFETNDKPPSESDAAALPPVAPSA
ncbi:tRNA-guanine(15) transglycosylase-like protein [Dactylonectria estremocensis]|uniref:Queuine tRNA-ribosyltransferase accessory subunit 2 n=1 Tax=Dactylonectria estremocensis TaxID=1079267 RepID=A0A9P9JCV2_9HYPO|nr:tRNA-guanine(15) transglycosylase-like protein [Dactylonectria estremocensis]